MTPATLTLRSAFESRSDSLVPTPPSPYTDSNSDRKNTRVHQIPLPLRINPTTVEETRHLPGPQKPSLSGPMPRPPALLPVVPASAATLSWSPARHAPH